MPSLPSLEAILNEEVLRIALIGIAAVFASLTLLVFTLIVLGKLIKSKNDTENLEQEIPPTGETISEIDQADSRETVAENSDKISEDNVLTPEDKELEEVAIIAAIAASMGVSSTQPQTPTAVLVRPPEGIRMWRLLGRQQFLQSQGVTPGTWKR